MPVYGPGVARKNAKELWNTLKLEVGGSFEFRSDLINDTKIAQIFQPTDIETETMALKTTQVLVQTTYGNQDTEAGEIEGLAKDACDECIRILKEPEKSQAKPAIKVLCAFMSTTRKHEICFLDVITEKTLFSASVARFTLDQVVPHLVKLFLDPDEVQNRGAVLQLLADVIGAARNAMALGSSTAASTGAVPMARYKDEVLGVLTVGLKVPSGRRHALIGLLDMVNTLKLLTDEELSFIVHNVNEILADGDVEDEDIRYAFLCLSQILKNRRREQRCHPRSSHRHIISIAEACRTDDIAYALHVTARHSSSPRCGVLTSEVLAYALVLEATVHPARSVRDIGHTAFYEARSALCGHCARCSIWRAGH